MSETTLLRRFRCWLEDKFQMNYTLQDINTVLFSVSILKGTQMCIRYHFLADLHITRHARETESEKRIQNTPNKPFRVELVASRNRDYRHYAISEHSFFVCHLYWEFTDGFVQGEPNIYKYFWIRSSAEVRNDAESAWIIVEGSRSWKLDFPNIRNLFHRFSKDIYNDYFFANIIDSFLLLFW